MASTIRAVGRMSWVLTSSSFISGKSLLNSVQKASDSLQSLETADTVSSSTNNSDGFDLWTPWKASCALPRPSRLRRDLGFHHFEALVDALEVGLHGVDGFGISLNGFFQESRYFHIWHEWRRYGYGPPISEHRPFLSVYRPLVQSGSRARGQRIAIRQRHRTSRAFAP